MPALETLETLNQISVFATSLPSLPAVSEFLHKIAGSAGISGSPTENWAIAASAVLLPWATGKIAWAWEVIGETRAVVEELREGVKLAAVVGLRILREVKGGKRMGGGSFARFAADQSVAQQGRGQGSRIAHVMVGGRSGGYPVRVLMVSRPARARKVAGKGIRRVG